MKGFSQTMQGSRGIIIKDNRILLSHEQKNDFYVFPGGEKEKTESFEACCVREIEEETGYKAEVLHPFVITNEFDNEIKYENHYFICKMIGERQQHLTEKEQERELVPEWMDINKALEIFSQYPKYKNTEFNKYSMTLREYTVLKRILEEGYGFNI